MRFAGLVKTTLVDYPGRVACVLFVRGCNYDCFYCHNRALLDPSTSLLDNREIESFLASRRGLLDGVVVSGGEPTLQPDLSAFLQSLRDTGFRVKLDTNGSSPSVVETLLRRGICDYYAVDYKAPADRYPEICGPGAVAAPVLHTVDVLMEAGVSFEVRTTVIPQLAPDDLIRMAEELPLLPRYVLNRYRPPERYLAGDKDRVSARPYSQRELESLAMQVRNRQPNVIF